MQKIKTTVKKTIAYLAKKSANMEANTACPCIGFQPKEPQTVKKLRKFCLLYTSPSPRDCS